MVGCVLMVLGSMVCGVRYVWLYMDVCGGYYYVFPCVGGLSCIQKKNRHLLGSHRSAACTQLPEGCDPAQPPSLHRPPFFLGDLGGLGLQFFEPLILGNESILTTQEELKFSSGIPLHKLLLHGVETSLALGCFLASVTHDQEHQAVAGQDDFS